MTQPPMRYADIIGQEDSIARLSAFSEFYGKQGMAAEPVLIVADEGMGKRTVANVLANELGAAFQDVSGSELQIIGDLSAILTNLLDRQVLAINGVHRLRRNLQNMLLESLRTNRLTISIGQGRSARRHVMELKPFTFVGTVPNKLECPEELLSCFALVLPLQPYTNEALEKIGERIAAQEEIEIDATAIRLVVANSRSCPGKLKRLMQRVARGVNKQRITEEDTLRALAAFGIVTRTNMPTGDPESLELMSGVEFEKLVTSLLARMEFRAEMTKATGDGGIDIVAVLDKPILGGKYLVQCKRYAPDNLVGASTVRDFYGAVAAEKAVKGILITTSDFTAQAREFAERVGLELINLGKLQDLMSQYGMSLRVSPSTDCWRIHRRWQTGDLLCSKLLHQLKQLLLGQQNLPLHSVISNMSFPRRVSHLLQKGAVYGCKQSIIIPKYLLRPLHVKLSRLVAAAFRQFFKVRTCRKGVVLARFFTLSNRACHYLSAYRIRKRVVFENQPSRRVWDSLFSCRPAQTYAVHLDIQLETN